VSEEQPLKPYPYQQKMIDDIRAVAAAGKPIRLKYNRCPVNLDYVISMYLLLQWKKQEASNTTLVAKEGESG
jgi:hypothetical protein